MPVIQQRVKSARGYALNGVISRSLHNQSRTMLAPARAEQPTMADLVTDIRDSVKTSLHNGHGEVETKPGSAFEVLGKMNKDDWRAMTDKLLEASQDRTEPIARRTEIGQNSMHIPCIEFTPGPDDTTAVRKSVQACHGASAYMRSDKK
jgi:hypothetical protein